VVSLGKNRPEYREACQSTAPCCMVCKLFIQSRSEFEFKTTTTHSCKLWHQKPIEFTRRDHSTTTGLPYTRSYRCYS